MMASSVPWMTRSIGSCWRMNQVYWYQSSEDYAKWAEQTYKQERGLIQRLGLLAKQKGMSETR